MSVPSRRSIRLPGFDYTTPGAYFITMCTHDRACLFGNVVNGAMRLNGLGEIVQQEWERSAEIRAELSIDAFVIMPNHFHGIVLIDGHYMTNDVDFCRGDAVHRPDGENCTNMFNRATHRDAPTLVSGSIGAIIDQFKSITTKHINILT